MSAIFRLQCEEHVTILTFLYFFYVCLVMRLLLFLSECPLAQSLFISQGSLDHHLSYQVTWQAIAQFGVKEHRCVEVKAPVSETTCTPADLGLNPARTFSAESPLLSWV